MRTRCREVEEDDHAEGLGVFGKGCGERWALRESSREVIMKPLIKYSGFMEFLHEILNVCPSVRLPKRRPNPFGVRSKPTQNAI